ncbi:hypothetical protein DXG01_004632 [Tephrocybe rancida]|nr:hypothetical protein DXG01_004632 [Tephrocybe rancida]
MVSFLLIPISTDEQTKTASAGLTNYLADPEWGSAQLAERSPWNRSTGIQESMFQYFEGATPEGAKAGARFGIGMSGWNEATQAAAVLRGSVDFPWGRFPPGTSVCDVGGGVGYVAMSLIKAYPNLQLKLQDLPDRIHQAETRVWPKDFPTAIDEKRIEFKAMDFFVDSPIEGCDVYYLKNILHDWPDNECITILRNIRAVLKPSGRVLIRRILFHRMIGIGMLKCYDYILQHAHRTGDVSGSGFVEAPEPLLPNYGEGRIRQYNLDMLLMVILNSRERTLEEFISMAVKADLKFVKLWDAGELGLLREQLSDVDGGVGHMAMELIKAYPNVQLILQDLPGHIRQVETDVCPKDLPIAIAAKRSSESKAMDIFIDSPVEGCDIYFVSV